MRDVCEVLRLARDAFRAHEVCADFKPRRRGDETEAHGEKKSLLGRTAVLIPLELKTSPGETAAHERRRPRTRSNLLRYLNKRDEITCGIS